jgi:hypothetical protein
MNLQQTMNGFNGSTQMQDTQQNKKIGYGSKLEATKLIARSEDVTDKVKGTTLVQSTIAHL